MLPVLDVSLLFDARRAGRLLTELALPKLGCWHPQHKPLAQRHAEDFVVSEIDPQGILSEAVQQTDQPGNSTGLLSFVLTKFRCSTETALGVLANAAGTTDRNFVVSGRKDTFALTSQRVQVPAQAFSLLQGVRPEWSGLWISGWRQEEGDLWHQGNFFQINLRWRKGYGPQLQERLQLQNAVACLGRGGFANQYGPQRFGLMAHVAGRHILRQEYREAMDASFASLAALSALRGFHDHEQALEQFLHSRDAQSARDAVLRLSGGRCSASRLLDAACQTSDPQAYWALLPDDSYFAVNALSSLLWNYMAAFRLEHYGWNVVEGDLVRQRTSTGMVLRHVQPGEECVFSLADVYLPRLLCKGSACSPQSGNMTPAHDELDVVDGQPICSSAPLFPALHSLEQYTQHLLESWGLSGMLPDALSSVSEAAARYDFLRPRLGFPFRSLICPPMKLGAMFAPRSEPSVDLSLFVPSKHGLCPSQLSTARSVGQLDDLRVQDLCAETEAAAKLQLSFVLPVGSFATCFMAALVGWERQSLCQHKSSPSLRRAPRTERKHTPA